MDDSSRLGPLFEAEGKGVGLYEKSVVPDEYFELVDQTRAQVGHEQFPYPGRPPASHLVPSPVPLVEIAYNAYPDSRRRPNGKENARDFLVPPGMRSQFLIDFITVSLVEEIEIIIGQDGPKGVAVVKSGKGSVAKVHFETVWKNFSQIG